MRIVLRSVYCLRDVSMAGHVAPMGEERGMYRCLAGETGEETTGET